MVYTKPTRQERRQRGPRAAISSKAQERLNLRRSTDKLEALIACNFGDGFWWVTLTYDNDHLPADRDGARKLLQKYLRKLRTVWRRQGDILKYIYVTQEVQSDGSLRLHHHLVLNRCGQADFDTIRSLWDCGDVQLEFLTGDDQITDKAIYMTHEPREHGKLRKGEQTWTPCRGLRRPEVETMDVPDEVTLEAPAGATVVERDSLRNEWGEYVFIKYWVPRRTPPGTA